MIFEVFRQERRGQAFAHAGSISAPDVEARGGVGARAVRPPAGVGALWVVPRESIRAVHDFPDELNKTYHRVDGYPLKAKLKEARERAGTTAHGECLLTTS